MLTKFAPSEARSISKPFRYRSDPPDEPIDDEFAAAPCKSDGAAIVLAGGVIGARRALIADLVERGVAERAGAVARDGEAA